MAENINNPVCSESKEEIKRRNEILEIEHRQKIKDMISWYYFRKIIGSTLFSLMIIEIIAPGLIAILSLNIKLAWALMISGGILFAGEKFKEAFSFVKIKFNEDFFKD